MRGTVFQQSVWLALHQIPKGRVTTYGGIAQYLKTKAVRAVGSALGKNPNAPDCPCHRVVLADGSVGNYSGRGGILTKIKLLESEGIQIREGKVVKFEEVLYDFRK